MSKKFLKILVVVCVLCSVVTLTLLPSSAEQNDVSVVATDNYVPINTYVFNSVLTIPDFLPAEEYLTFICDGVQYEPIWLLDGDHPLEVWYDEGGYLTPVYNSVDGWADDKYRLITVISPYNDGDSGFTSWFLENTTHATIPPESPPFPVYDNLYGIVTEYIYGGSTDLDNFQSLTATLISTLGSILVLVLPFVVIFVGIKLILGLVRF